MTWAHQPPPYGFEQHSHPSAYQNQRFPVGSYPFHVQERVVHDHYARDGAFSTSPTAPRSRRLSEGMAPSSTVVPARGIPTDQDITTPAPDNEGDSTHSNSQLDHTPTSPRSIRNSTLFDVKEGNVEESTTGSKLDWTEMDFPPLVELKAERKTKCGVWGERKASRNDEDAVDRFVSYHLTVSAVPLTDSTVPGLLRQFCHCWILQKLRQTSYLQTHQTMSRIVLKQCTKTKTKKIKNWTCRTPPG